MTEPLDFESIKARHAARMEMRAGAAGAVIAGVDEWVRHSTQQDDEIAALIAEVERLRVSCDQMLGGLVDAMSCLQSIQHGPGNEAGLRHTAERGWSRVNAVFMANDPRFR